jgi:Domain of unknown function (DUF4259)
MGRGNPTLSLRSALALTIFMLVAPCLFAGAWGYGTFENDDALDWLDDLQRQSNSQLLVTALGAADPHAKYIEAAQCSQALAAAEIVAAARGHASKTLPADAVQWVKRVKLTVTAEFLGAARSAVETCRNSDHSELRALWLESKQPSPWLAETASLLSRLR